LLFKKKKRPGVNLPGLEKITPLISGSPKGVKAEPPYFPP